VGGGPQPGGRCRWNSPHQSAIAERVLPALGSRVLAVRGGRRSARFPAGTEPISPRGRRWAPRRTEAGARAGVTMRRTLGLASLVLVLSLVTGPAWGASEAELDELHDQIAELASQIDSAQAAKTQAGSDLLAAQARFDDLVGQVRAAEAELASTEATISAGEAQLAELTASLDRFEAALASTRLRVAGTKESLSEQVVELYINASTA